MNTQRLSGLNNAKIGLLYQNPNKIRKMQFFPFFFLLLAIKVRHFERSEKSPFQNSKYYKKEMLSLHKH